MLEAHDLRKTFKGRTVVNGVSLNVARGEVVGLLGPNGAGKSTTFHMIVGLTSPDAGPDGGRVTLDGADLTHLPMYQRARRGISYLPQDPSVFRQLSVEENILAILETLPLNSSQRRERLEELLEKFGLGTVRRSKGYMLSGGERRRVEIARSLVLSPHYILLDEPFSGIDPIAVLDIQRMIGQFKQEGIGVLITDHNVRETLRVTDRAYIINDGLIFRAGAPAELGADPEVRRVYLGESFVLEPV
ncbi:MAG: LPS export ABC transporter ATP-binding protein [Acidobacteria bacterium]|nr:LPS export ABC transporter ATP-binding protein [Acidobacteriota bacterium]